MLLALGLGCTPPGKPGPADRPTLPDQLLSFDALFADNCAGCHGAAGDFGPAPLLNDPLFLAIIPDEELRRVVQEGRAGTPMPGFLKANGGTLTEEQVTVLVDGLKSRWGPGENLPDSTPPYLLTKQDAEDATPSAAERGAAVFARACAGCHGARGEGKPDAPDGAGAINSRAFLALTSDQALRRIIITGRADLGMPNFAQTTGRPSDFQPLTSDEINDVVALLSVWEKSGAVAQARGDE